MDEQRIIDLINKAFLEKKASFIFDPSEYTWLLACPENCDVLFQGDPGLVKTNTVFIGEEFCENFDGLFDISHYELGFQISSYSGVKAAANTFIYAYQEQVSLCDISSFGSTYIEF